MIGHQIQGITETTGVCLCQYCLAPVIQFSDQSRFILNQASLFSN